MESDIVNTFCIERGATLGHYRLRAAEGDYVLRVVAGRLTAGGGGEGADKSLALWAAVAKVTQ